MYKHYKNGFYISDQGQVMRIRKDKKSNVKLYKTKNGHLFFILFNSNDRDKIYVHRAVASLFVPQPARSKYIVDHINRNKTDNRAVNLRWVNHSENMKNRDNWEQIRDPRSNTKYRQSKIQLDAM